MLKVLKIAMTVKTARPFLSFANWRTGSLPGFGKDGGPERGQHSTRQISDSPGHNTNSSRLDTHRRMAFRFWTFRRTATQHDSLDLTRPV
jgi:hypothetical protein